MTQKSRTPILAEQHALVRERERVSGKTLLGFDQLGSGFQTVYCFENQSTNEEDYERSDFL